MFKRFAFLFCFLFLISLTSAVPPFQTGEQVFTEGYVIDSPDYDIHKIDTNLTYNFHVFNISNGMAIEKDIANCEFHLYDSSGVLIYENNNVSIVGDSWQVFIGSGNLSQRTYYGFLVHCNSSTLSGFISGSFEVSGNGVETPVGKIHLMLGLLFLCFLFFTISILGVFKTENYIGKFTCYWISHLLIMLIMFMSWMVADGCLGDGSIFIGIFRVLFLFFTIAMLPMILLSIAWIVYIHIMTDEIKGLIEKGESPETALEITKRKKKGGLF